MCNCYCVVCNERMVAKKGTEREHHFAHESNKADCVINHETLLHMFAKRVIQDAGGLVVPPDIERKLTGSPQISQSNPTWLMLNRVEEEKKLDDIRPDLIGYTWDTQVLIEVAYSSFVGDEKLAKLEAHKLLALEIDLSEFDPENFDLETTKEAILNGVELKRWLFFPEPAVADNNRAFTEEIVTIKGIWVSLKTLQYGDLAVKVVAFNPEVNAIVKAIAKRYYGRWRQDYKNWIVPSHWLQHAINDLRAEADKV
ncbi:competence protein CoiA family protein [Methylomarinum sp. Ch1-1]|uniref:Competence protein CoiA family protein n=1 Tax=Methylomarinum roseum TaxID=3067653 RepID=A0AAU7NZM1_9GAMM